MTSWLSGCVSFSRESCRRARFGLGSLLTPHSALRVIRLLTDKETRKSSAQYLLEP